MSSLLRYISENVQTYTSAKPNENLLFSFGFSVLLHPPYILDMVSSDFHLFRSPQHFLNETLFSVWLMFCIMLSGLLFEFVFSGFGHTMIENCVRTLAASSFGFMYKVFMLDNF